VSSVYELRLAPHTRTQGEADSEAQLERLRSLSVADDEDRAGTAATYSIDGRTHALRRRALSVEARQGLADSVFGELEELSAVRASLRDAPTVDV
jgi:hypothetical protein